MLPFVLLWAHQQAHLDGTAAGLVFLAQAAGEFGAGLVIGSFADRLGRRRVLIGSTLGMAVGYGLLAVADAPVPAVGLFLVAGVFESAFHPVIGAMVGDLVPEQQLRSAFGWIRIAANTGRVVGPLLGSLLILLALPAVFIAAGGLLAIAAAVLAVVLPRDVAVQAEDDEPEVPPGTLQALLTDPALAMLVLAAGLLAIAFTWFEADGLVILRRQTEVSSGTFGVLFAVAAVTVIVGQVPLSRWSAAAGVRTLVLAGGAIQAAGLAMLILAPLGYPVLVASVVTTAIGESLTAPAIAEVVTLRAGARRRASYLAALSISQDLGSAVGPLSGLALVQAAGPAAAWAVGAVLSLGSGAALAAVIGRRQRTGRTGAAAPTSTANEA